MKDRRMYKRLEKEYLVEYSPFPALAGDKCLKSGCLINLGAGGALFNSEKQFPAGSQLLLNIHISGWKQCDGMVEKVSGEDSEVHLKAIVKVVHADFDLDNKCYLIGAEFLGQVNN